MAGLQSCEGHGVSWRESATSPAAGMAIATQLRVGVWSSGALRLRWRPGRRLNHAGGAVWSVYYCVPHAPENWPGARANRRRPCAYSPACAEGDSGRWLPNTIDRFPIPAVVVARHAEPLRRSAGYITAVKKLRGEEPMSENLMPDLDYRGVVGEAFPWGEAVEARNSWRDWNAFCK